MGVVAHGSAYTRPFPPPIDMSRNFPPHVSAESSSNIYPNPSEVISLVSEPFANFPKYPLIPQIIFLTGILIFVLLWSPCKILESYDNF